MNESRRFARASLMSLLLHFAGGLSMLLVLRHGLETNPDTAARLAFVARQPRWVLGWVPWNLAAFSILWFFVCARRARPELTVWTVALTALAVCGDLGAEAIEMIFLPPVALRALESGSAEPFLALHRRAVLLTGFLANGLYTAASALLVASLRRAVPPWISTAGWAVVAAGTGVSAAAWLGSPGGLFWTNAALVPAITLWQLGLFWHFRR